jgi:(4-O-methyl)-D-glucuronate---lignin esterase
MKHLASLIVITSAIGRLHAAELDLPDPLTMRDGTKVTSAEMWKTQRRPELLELFRQNVYGRAPIGRPENLKFEVTEVDPQAMEGKATRRQVKISYARAGGDGAIHLVLFIPNIAVKPAPCFLLICNRGVENIDPTREKKSPFWPAEEIIARGYAAAAFFNGDVAPDKKDAWQSGAHAIFDGPKRAPDSWGTIAAWAWGASRVLDYLDTDKAVDAKRVAVVGHSRGGKTALWVGAEDERFALIVSNDSGCTGAKLARHPKGETVERINTVFPHWFCENYKRFNGHPEALPVDQHELIALIAPRPVYVASASEDGDPRGEFLGALYAAPAYELFGFRGLPESEFPKPDTTFGDGQIGYHLRPGPHNLLEYDWQRFMDFADRHMPAK